MEVIIPNMHKEFIVDEPQRLDKFLSSKLNISRNQIEQLIKKEYVTVDNKIISLTSLLSFGNLRSHTAQFFE